MQLMINTTRDICDVTLSVYPHYIFVTSQISYSPEYTTPTQKEKKSIILLVLFEKCAKLHSPRRLVQFWHIFQISLVVLIINCTPSRVITYTN